MSSRVKGGGSTITPYLFSGTVRENILLGLPNDSVDARAFLDAAISGAALEEDLRSFPDGLETEIGELGIRVSGGQRQRIVVEDRGSAVLTVDHRLSTAREADRVLVMESGQIVEEGSPEVLVQHGGRFAALLELEAAGWNWQSDGSSP